MARSFVTDIVIDAPVERIWRALTHPAELNRWETTDVHLDLRPGGGFLYEYAYGPSRPGTFLVVDPPSRLMQDNLVFNGDRGYHYVNTIDLAAAADGTRVSVLVEGYGDGLDEQWLRESMELGWATDLLVLKAWVEREEDIRPVVWRGLRMGLRYVSASAGDPAATGILLLEVFAGQPADRAGLRPGDVVVAVDGDKVDDFRGFRALIGGHDPGDTVLLSVVRDGGTVDVPLRFGAV